MGYRLVLLLAGLAVYAGYGWGGLCCLLADALLCYCLGRLMKRHRWLFWPGVVVQAAALLLFKFQGALPWSLTAPLGLSYFTLSLIGYLADVYRGTSEPETNVLTFLLCITYLPRIFQGPIEPYRSMRQAVENPRFSWEAAAKGITRMLWGAFKKLVVAARVQVLVGAISADPETYAGAWALLAMLLYSIELYADFSGAMDLVIGGSQILGIPLSENFHAPFLSQSVAEFWRRWHITLGAWLRTYVYIPLGGNRKGRVRKVLNCLITFLVSGLWHGPQYLLWGLLNGVFVSLGDKLKTRWKTLNRVITFLIISLLWAFFIWPDTGTALQMVGSLFTSFRLGSVLSGIGSLGLTAADCIVLAAGVAAMVLADWKGDGWNRRTFPPAAQAALIGALALAVLVFGRYGIGFVASEFIYSRF